ncbi:hypothetical protein GUJ93_ZPchr0006g40819 [Zizania palustris]|uniref:Uncharacterized protein n=1 Tax=Zizania palustris TaxID=103762 RepID=A0A8J5VLY7_ZIZPA|nr:hypothetical protein GUJ93_ZPchr0006g40819 [Zizania palustris]
MEPVKDLECAVGVVVLLHELDKQELEPPRGDRGEPVRCVEAASSLPEEASSRSRCSMVVARRPPPPKSSLAVVLATTWTRCTECEGGSRGG